MEEVLGEKRVVVRKMKCLASGRRLVKKSTEIQAGKSK